MGVVRLPAYEDYWSSKYGEFVCARYISLNRFEDLKRYLHISNLISNGSLSDSQEDSLEDETPETSIGWWYKLEPIASEFRNSYSKYWISGINVSIDEMIIQFFGQSKYTFKAPDKPIKEGYKIFALCEVGYIYYFM
jgi:Transposase IS4